MLLKYAIALHSLSPLHLFTPFGSSAHTATASFIQRASFGVPFVCGGRLALYTLYTNQTSCLKFENYTFAHRFQLTVTRQDSVTLFEYERCSRASTSASSHYSPSTKYGPSSGLFKNLKSHSTILFKMLFIFRSYVHRDTADSKLVIMSLSYPLLLNNKCISWLKAKNIR